MRSQLSEHRLFGEIKHRRNGALDLVMANNGYAISATIFARVAIELIITHSMYRFIYIYNPTTAPLVNIFGLPPKRQSGAIHQIYIYTVGGANGTLW